MLLFMYLFQARLTEKKFRPALALGIYTILCWSSDAPPPLVQQKFKFLASSIVQVSMSSSLWCCQCVSSQLDTHIAEVLAGVTLSVNAFECWHARGPSRLARLVKDLTCATASQAYMWNASFLPVGCSILDDEELCSGVWDERLYKTQTVLEETSCPR